MLIFSRVPLNKLRVGILLSSLGLVRGGLETIAFEFGRGLAARGHQVTFITGKFPALSSLDEFRNQPIQQVRVLCIPSHLFFWRPLLPFRPGFPLLVQSLTFSTSCHLSQNTRRLLPQFDVTLTFLEVETALISDWRKSFSLPHVSYFSGGISEKWTGQDRSTMRIAISKTIATRYTDQYGLRIDGVVTPGVTEEWFKSESQIRKQPQTLTYIGRLEANKGIVELIAIFEELARDHPTLNLRLIGHGPLLDWVEKTTREVGLANRVHCLGSRPLAEVQQELRQADVFVFPSHYESFGIAVLEALASGIPVVCSDIPALREVTGGAAFHLPPNDIMAWVATLRVLLADPQERARLAVAGREQAKRNKWTESITNLEQHLYRAVKSELPAE